MQLNNPGSVEFTVQFHISQLKAQTVFQISSVTPRLQLFTQNNRITSSCAEKGKKGFLFITEFQVSNICSPFFYYPK